MNGRSINRLTAVSAAVALALVGACQEDNLNGPAKISGDPLLDITLSFPGNAVFPSGSFAITAAASRDSLTVTLANLAPLPAGRVYQVLLSDSSTVDSAGTNNVVPFVGRLIRTTRAKRPVNRDSAVAITTIDTTASAASLTAADTNQTFVLLGTNASLGATIINYSHVMVIVTTNLVGAGTLDRTTRRGFLYGRYRDAKGTPARGDDTFAGGALTFGSFAINSLTRLPFVKSGTLLKGAFRGRELRMTMLGLVRPPEGWRYATWLLDDRTGRQVRLGNLVSPVPADRSLEDADVENTSDETSVGILSAQVRGFADSVAGGPIEFDDFTRVALLIEPKGGTAPQSIASSALVIGGSVPASVATRHPSAGRLFGVVNSGIGNFKNTAIYLTGVGQIYPLLVTSSDSTGAFKIRSINVGTYTLNAVPKDSTVAKFTGPVTIGKNPADPTVGDSIFVTINIP